MDKKKHSFRKKILNALLLFSVFLVLTICIAISTYYKQQEMQQYSKLAYAYAKTAAEYIEGDRIAEYVESQETDDYYQQVLDFLNATQSHADLLYYYVFVPYEKDLVYVWDATQKEGACPLGYREEYMEGGAEMALKIMAGDFEEEIQIVDDDTYGYIGSAYYPLKNSAGENVALVGVDLPMPDINQNLMAFNMVIMFAVIAVILLFILILYLNFNKAFIEPINQLNQVTKNMVGRLESDCEMEIQIDTGDEIEELASSFNHMYVEVKEYIHKLSDITKEKERIGAELSIATHIQSSMLPCIFPAFPEKKEIDIYATMNPAKEVGGDFYDFFMVDERHLAIVMADVSGKGVPAALFMVIGKTLIKDHTQPGRDLGEVFTEVNNLLCESNSEGLFITAFEGVLDLVSGEFRFVNAGHEMPFVCKKSGTYEPYKIRAGFVLAGMEGIRYKAGSMQLEPGDKIFQYTDGVTEATNAAEELYGMERLTKTLQQYASKSPMELLPAIKEDIDAFVGEAVQFDDITMLCLEYRERMTENQE